MTATSVTPPTTPAGRPSLWRHREFMKLWTGETISQFGTQVSALAIPLIAALFLHVTPFEFGLLATVEFLPFILISLPAGVWVDRLRRKPIMIVGDLGRAVALLSIPIAAYYGVLTIWQLYLVGFINGCLTVFFDVSYQAYLPSLVERDDILEGNSKLEISRSAAQITGPGIAGFLIGLISAPAAIFIDSASFVGSAFFLWRIKKPEPIPQRKTDAEGKHVGMRTEIGEGLRWVLGSPYLRAIAACTATSNLFGNMGFAIVLLYAVSAVASGGLGLNAQSIGIILSLGSIGALVAALTANRIGRALGVGRTIVISIFLGAPPALVIALDAARPGRTARSGRAVRAHLQRCRLQHQPGQLPPGHYALPDAGSNERNDAFHCLGHDPDCEHDRRVPGRNDRSSADSYRQRRFVVHSGSAGSVLARAHHPRDAGADD